MQAIRKLSFHQSEPVAFQADVGRAIEKILTNPDKFPPRQPAQKADGEAGQISMDGASGAGKLSDQSADKPDVPVEPSVEGAKTTDDAGAPCQAPETLLEASLDQPVTTPGGDLETAPSVTQLPKFLDALDNQTEDTDHEVTVITTASTDDDGLSEEGSDTPSHLPSHLNTAESVAAFMKKVHRLRFNSINVARDPTSKIAKTERSRSCPNFDPDEGENDGAGSEYKSSTLPKQKAVLPRIPSVVDTRKKMTRCNSSQTSLYALSSALLDKKTSKTPIVAAETSTETDRLDPESPFETFPYQELFSMAMPFSPYVQCYSCVMNQAADGTSSKTPINKQPAIDDCVPLFSSYSPAELLDRILDQAHKAHGHQKVMTPGGKVLTPDLSSCSDVGVLRGQIEMLHNQLMFERHKRELHAQRNRRLLSRIVKTTALQEENNAMKDQLQLQERELMSLRTELTQQQKLGQQLQATTAVHEADTEKMQKSYGQKMESLQNRNKDIEAELEEAKLQREKAYKEMQSHQYTVYTLTKEVEALTKQTQGTNELKEQVKRLNKELLLMGELQQKYQSRLVALNSNENSSTHMQFLLETYKVELNSVKNNLSQKTIELNAIEGQLADCTSKLEAKDDLIENVKQMMETARDTFLAQVESVESKYQALKKSHLALQTEFLTLNHQIGCMKAAEQRARLSVPPRHGAATARRITPVEASGASTGAEGLTEWPGPGVSSGQGQDDNGQGSGDCPAEWSAPASVSSVESAEEAVAMDTSQ